MAFSKEMQRALEADGEKLRQLTGQDHGPYFVEREVRFVLCTHCSGEGRIFSGHPNDPNPRDIGPCPVCSGECVEEVEVEPIDANDLTTGG